MASKLKELVGNGKLNSVAFSDNGNSLTIGDSKIDAQDLIELEKDGNACRYSTASIFLQIIDPNQSLLAYRKACKKYNVNDPVKATDKPIVVGYFFGSKETAAPAEPVPKAKDDRKKHRKHDRKDRQSKEHRKRPAPPEGPPPKKKEKKIMTTEEMLDNLNVVAGKREGGAGDNEELADALSAEGFDLTPELIKESISNIVSLELPVGNSASILRPAPNRDFQRVLELYMETEKKKKPQPPTTPKRAHLVGKRPIIIIPKAMTSPVTMWNAHEFLANAKFVPRDIMIKKGATKATLQTIVRHKMDQRRGGGTLEFELMDNPTTKLGSNMNEWDRVVAVLSLGAGWQFADWPRGYKTPVDLFEKTFGFYIGLEGNKLPTDLSKWAVKTGFLSRDKRGLDSVCYANFWDGLEDRMVTKKPELLPQKEE